MKLKVVWTVVAVCLLALVTLLYRDSGIRVRIINDTDDTVSVNLSVLNHTHRWKETIAPNQSNTIHFFADRDCSLTLDYTVRDTTYKHPSIGYCAPLLNQTHILTIHSDGNVEYGVEDSIFPPVLDMLRDIWNRQ